MTTVTTSLAATALASLRVYFEAKSHHPSDEHWTALEDVATTMEAMANGIAKPNVYLSAIDPGVGKSQTAIHFARALMNSPGHGEIGMIICVGRKKEAESLAAELSNYRSRLAVMTSDESLNDLGGCSVDQAQVLITTQQRIERVTESRTFTEASSFHFHGQPRQVRVWDEAWSPGQAMTLGQDDLLFLPKAIRPWSHALADAVAEFGVSLGKVPDGAAVEVPDFEARYAISLAEIIAAVAGAAGRLRDDQQMAATALVALNGKTARLRRDGRTGAAILTYRNTLPADLAPLVVLDASARVRQTYRDMEQYRGGIIRLAAAVKDYSPLTIRTWRRSGAKSGFAKHSDELAKGIAEVIKTRPLEPWLLVVHKSGSGGVGDTVAAVRRNLPVSVRPNVAAITWGEHMATNDYADHPNVILAGTLFFKDSFYTALTHMAQDRDTAPGLATTAEINRTRLGEHANLILQALCRGRVRKSDGSKCLPMDAYIIASAKSGIPSHLDTIFPGAVVADWNPLGSATLKVRAAELFLRRWLDSEQSRIRYRDIQREIGCSSDNFAREVTRRPEWPGILHSLGLVPFGGRRKLGLELQRAASPHPRRPMKDAVSERCEPA